MPWQDAEDSLSEVLTSNSPRGINNADGIVFDEVSSFTSDQLSDYITDALLYGTSITRILTTPPVPNTTASELMLRQQSYATSANPDHQPMTLETLQQARREVANLELDYEPPTYIIQPSMPGWMNTNLDLNVLRPNRLYRGELGRVCDTIQIVESHKLTKLEEPNVNSLLERQTRELEHNLADLYVNNNCDRLFRQANINSPYESSTNNVLPECWTDNNANHLYWYDEASRNSYSIVIDFHDRNEQCYTQKQRNYRCDDWHQRRQTLRQRAQDALFRALRDTRKTRRVALKGGNLYAERQNLNVAIKSLLKRLPHPASIDPAVQRPQFYNNLFTWYEELTLQMGGYCYYSVSQTLSRLSVSKNYLTAPATSDFTTELDGFTDCAYFGYSNKYGQKWEKIAWRNESWFTNSKYYTTHALHVSTSAPSLLAYTSCGDKLMRNIQTQTKPGRYLQQFFSDILSEKDIRYWAERQQSYVESSELKLVPNTDPDGWVWVYEHPSGFSSCMQYDHNSRYLDNRLGPDTPYHPVRVYCHPDNHLALAYLGDDYKQFPRGRVYARAIVNTERKTWVRIYGDSRIQHQLERAGYSHDSGDTLKNEKLQKIELPWGGWAMPYLDGGCIMVDEHCDHFKVRYDGYYDAHNSSGMMDSSSITCPCCGDTVNDEDDLTYVEHRGESICLSCLDDRYRYAYGRRGHQEYYPEDDCVRCESDHEWYLVNYLSNNDVYECEISGNYYSIDDLSVPNCGDFEGQYVHCDYIHELPDGETCCIERYEDDFDKLVAAHSDEEEEEEEEETDDDTPGQEVSCAPVISATASDEQFSIAA